jgi:hypothetical protein
MKEEENEKNSIDNRPGAFLPAHAFIHGGGSSANKGRKIH